MPAPIDLNALIGSITRTASDELGRDVTTVDGFARDQVEALARHAQLIAAAIASGSLSQSQADFFRADLQLMAQNFVNTLKGLAEVDLEKVWNAVVSTLWGAIDAALGLAL